MISNLNQNIFFWDASAETFTEYTKNLNDYDRPPKSLTFETGDRLYFANSLPFNHRYFNLTQLNASTDTNLIVEYYSADSWVNPSRVLDYTESVAGATFGQSGIMQFVPDNKEIIGQMSDTDVMDQNFKDHAPSVYDMFWSAIGFDATTTIGFNYAGQLFCADDDLLYARYPLLNERSFLEQWDNSQGKSDWEQQRVYASEEIVKELKRRSLIVGRDQVLDTAELEDACIHQTAQMIFSGLGVERFAKEIELCGNRYSRAMNMERYNFDQNANALLEAPERQVRVSLRSR